jgi:hypothetical protein
VVGLLIILYLVIGAEVPFPKLSKSLPGVATFACPF